MPDDQLATAPPAPAGPPCTACPATAVVQWARRATDDPTSTRAVYGCVQHAITLDGAAHIHQPTCPAPDPALLPACGCTPEPLPPPEPLTPPTNALPPGWTTP